MLKKCETCSQPFTWWNLLESTTRSYNDLKCSNCNTVYEPMSNKLVFLKIIIFILFCIPLFAENLVDIKVPIVVAILYSLIEPCFIVFKKKK